MVFLAWISQSVEATLCELRGQRRWPNSTLVPQNVCGDFSFLARASYEGKEKDVLKKL